MKDFNKLLIIISGIIILVIIIAMKLNIVVSRSQVFSGILIVIVISAIYFVSSMNKVTMNKKKPSLNTALNECIEFWKEANYGEILTLTDSKAYPQRGFDGKIIENIRAILLYPAKSQVPVIFIYDMLIGEIIGYDSSADSIDNPLEIYSSMKKYGSGTNTSGTGNTTNINLGKTESTKFDTESEHKGG